MKRTDDTLFFHDKLDTFFEIENNENPRPSKKKYLKYSIIISLAVLVITTVLLVGYFKFNWFKSEPDEYDIDIKIQSFSNQVNYFTEKKQSHQKWYTPQVKWMKRNN